MSEGEVQGMRKLECGMRKIRKYAGQNITVEGIGYKVEGVRRRNEVSVFSL